MDKQPIATRQPKATEWKQGSEPLRPSAEMVHYAHADDLPTEFMADNFDKLANLVGRYMGKEDCDLVERAYCFAAEKHCAQKRRSGEAYINHPVEVAIILAELKMDCDVVCAALLHDTVEDTTTSLDDVTTYFGETVAELVDGVTKLTNIDVDTMDEKQALNLRKMFLALSEWRNSLGSSISSLAAQSRLRLRALIWSSRRWALVALTALEPPERL